MDAYQYGSLSQNPQEIRLLKLYPAGNLSADIHISLSSIRLPEQRSRAHESNTFSKNSLPEPLREHWLAHETFDGRFLFVQRLKDTLTATWTHPLNGKRYDTAPSVSHLSSIPEYEALSYCWGASTAKVDIIVHTKTDARRLGVGSNLDSALRYFRYSDRPRCLWVDAICINQNDETERNHQVTMMADIYSAAKEVLIWLGEPSNDSDQALDILQDIGSQVEFSRKGFRLPVPEAKDSSLWDSNTPLPYPEASLAALGSLAQRPWFQRLWVVQEAALASSALMCCGSKTVSWNILRRAVACIHVKAGLSPQVRESIGPLTIVATILEAPFAFTLRGNHMRACRDPRDRIYGLLGLAPRELARLMRPQYSSKVERVYQDATESQIQYFHRLDNFRWTGKAASHVHALPSWVVDLAADADRTDDFDSQFSAGCSRANVTFDSHIMKATGIRCCMIDEIKTCVPTGDAEALEVIRSWIPGDLTGSFHAGGTMRDAYARLLCANSLRDRYPQVNQPSLEQWNDRSNPFFGEDRGTRDLASLNAYERMWLNFLKAKVLFISKEGYIGLGSPELRQNDVICVFLGCDFPMALREDSAGHFQVIDQVFVAGLSDANALLGPLPDGWEVQFTSDSALVMRNYRYFNAATQESREDDPRLEPLDDWERIQRPVSNHDPVTVDWFRNKSTGEIINSDPRLLPHELKKRGVRLEQLSIV